LTETASQAGEWCSFDALWTAQAILARAAEWSQGE